MQFPTKQRRGVGLVALAVVLSGTIAGCATDAAGPKAATPTGQASLVAEGVSQTRALQGDLARLVALSLADPNLREHIRQDMRDAPTREFKLDFSAYVRGVNGSQLVTSMAQRKVATTSEVLSQLMALPPLEFYMPVEAHRTSWTGDANLIVAASIEDTEQPIAWDLKGNRVILDSKSPPAKPVLVLVPIETDFRNVLSPGEVLRRGDPNRRTIQGASTTSRAVVGQGFATGDVGTASFPDGLYITFQRLVDRGEPWFMGAPEIEVHVHGPTSATNPHYGADLSCSGDRLPVPRGFNQDNSFWNGNALVFSLSEIEAYNAIQPNGFQIMVWEDDNVMCSLKLDSPTLVQRVTAIGAAAGGYTAVVIATGFWPTAIAAAGFAASVYQTVTQPTADDFLGTYVNAAAVGLSYGDANHVLYMTSGQINGRAMLVNKDY